MKSVSLNARWIMSGAVNDKSCSLPPEIYRKTFSLKEIESTRLRITALGIYTAYINGKRVGNDYFTPGYTNYKSHVQLQSYDVSALVKPGQNEIEITVANGWYLGRIGNKFNVFGNCRAVMAELTAGNESVITDESWLVSFDGETRFSDFYDGETIDRSPRVKCWQAAKLFAGKVPELIEQIGTFVREMGVLTPERSGNIFDFGQNFAGTVCLKVRASSGTVITVRHAEILTDGKPFFDNYRSARATLTFICAEGENEFLPRFTYTGFRYVEISSSGSADIVSVTGIVLHSDMRHIGNFACSDERLNKLHNCILWSAKSNFMDIPTDCPQRDERLGWTGDIGIFSRTADYLFDTRVFFRKYMADIRSEQTSDGAVPAAVPYTGMYQPKNRPIPLMMWGDAAVMIPWDAYLSYGDKEDLAASYDCMKKYVLCEKAYAEKYGTGYRKYLWNRNPYQFGDWCAYGKSWVTWNKRGAHLATLWYFNSVNLVAKAARELGYEEDEKIFENLTQKIQDAFLKTYLKEDGRLRHADFESMYVCALHFGIIPEEYRAKVAMRLANMVKTSRYRVMTGFPGTPYLLFALADNGYEDIAFRVLLNEDCPGWLHMVKHGATTVWERWDAIEQDGRFFHGGAGMVSFNHCDYAVVGDFLYRRILGLEPLEAGYRFFRVRPICGTIKEATGHLTTPYGSIGIAWRKTDKLFVLDVTVPDGTTAEIVLPDGKRVAADKGKNHYEIRN